MKIKIFCLTGYDIYNTYTVTFEQEVTVDNIESIIKGVKKKFKMSGKHFIALAGDDVYFVTKLGKKWKSYLLEKAEEKDGTEIDVSAG